MKKPSKKVMVLLITLAVFAIPAMAALLVQYGHIVFTANVEQAVALTGDGCTDNECAADLGSVVGGEIVETCDYVLTNMADTPREVGFIATPLWFNGAEWEDASDAVEVEFFGTIELENKDPATWQPISDDVMATLRYNLVDHEFMYTVVGEVPLGDTEYSLIYYADQQDRFDNWGGDPLIVIGTATSDEFGVIAFGGSTDFSDNLPLADDWNANPDPLYCSNGIDNYRQCSGAKIWLVPSADVPGIESQTVWNPTEYLFETDLIHYSDSDLGDAYTIAPEDMDLCVRMLFHELAMPGDYEVMVTVEPR